jgi:hypothetical protein
MTCQTTPRTEGTFVGKHAPTAHLAFALLGLIAAQLWATPAHRSGPVRLNSIPRFISGLRAGW